MQYASRLICITILAGSACTWTNASGPDRASEQQSLRIEPRPMVARGLPGERFALTWVLIDETGREQKMVQSVAVESSNARAVFVRSDTLFLASAGTAILTLRAQVSGNLLTTNGWQVVVQAVPVVP